ncbi:MAG: hypothetical protein KTR31_12015 [Myxococcales bacterium]|nr:hypothetical protein [Myxococcales bacterium]
MTQSMLVLLALTPASIAAPDDDQSAYELHVRQLDALSAAVDVGHGSDRNPSDETGRRHLVPQIDEGLVTVWGGAKQVGFVFAENLTPVVAGESHMEHWFWSHTGYLANPATGFTLKMEDPTATADDVVDLLEQTKGADWEATPYAAVLFDYTEQPPASMTAPMTYAGGQVTFHHFELEQDGQLVGAMLREAHLGEEAPHFVEHWLFLEGFEMLTQEGDRLDVIGKPSGPASAAAYFAQFEEQGATYAQPAYDATASAADFE